MFSASSQDAEPSVRNGVGHDIDFRSELGRYFICEPPTPVFLIARLLLHRRKESLCSCRAA